MQLISSGELDMAGLNDLTAKELNEILVKVGLKGETYESSANLSYNVIIQYYHPGYPLTWPRGMHW